MKRIITALLTALVLLSAYSCKNADNTKNEKNTSRDNMEISEESSKLTLDIVTELSKKGEDLTWKDFEAYDHIDTGSGLYIRVYEIDDDYKLSIGGTHPDIPPMYIYLTCKRTAYQRIDIRYDDVRGFIEESSKIKDGTKRFTAEVIQNGEAIAPAGKSELGMTLQTGKLILSVKDIGNTELENDALCSISTEDLTGTAKLPRLLIGDTVRVELDSDSEITEYSFDPTVMINKAVSIQRCTELGNIIAPLEELDTEGYNIDNARNDNAVYFRDFDVLFGKEYFESFLAHVKYGTSAAVRLAHYYTESHTLYVSDLYYDGTAFTHRELDKGMERLQTYKYLRPFLTDITEDSARLAYTLTDDANVTYDRLFRGALSSKYGDYIPFRDVYSQKGFLKDGKFYDSSQKNKENPKPESLYNIK